MKLTSGLILLLISLTFLCDAQTGHNHGKDPVALLHDRILTVDSHTDTPLRFTRSDFNFSEKHDPWQGGSKIDLPRMKSGGLDGVFLAVFLGQGERTDEGYREAKRKTYEIFDSIYSVVRQNPDDLDLVMTPREFKKSARHGRHSVFIGVENGYPLGKDVSMVDTLFNLGARYITLCHTRNNDICDSSTDPGGPEHGGLSPFGAEVVKRMNELGMMVDISHASDESFYDVLEISTRPVIASHSCARAICDNPRNLDDDMLRALAGNGGVVQMCILSAYIEEPVPNPQRDSARIAVVEKHGDYYELDDAGKNAFLDDWYKVDRDFPPILTSVSKVVDHIDHIVKVAGIDHIGIGTDFDGGGGLEDCYDVSQIINITRELMRRGYSEKDIQKIWAGNLMRVMKNQG